MIKFKHTLDMSEKCVGVQVGTLEIVHYIFHSKFQEMSCLHTNASLISLCTILGFRV
jgi:hypothetical protein